MMSKAALNAALRGIANAVVATVAEFPDGAPMGPMYMAFMHYGMSLDMFNTLVASLVEVGRVKQRGDCLFPA